MSRASRESGWAGAAVAFLRSSMKFVFTWGWAAIPAWINFMAVQDPLFRPIIVMLSFIAPLCIHAAMDVWRPGKRLASAGIMLLGLLSLLIFNIPNAVKIMAENRAGHADPRAAEIGKHEQLLKSEADLNQRIKDLEKGLDGKTTADFQASVNKATLEQEYRDSRSCSRIRGDTQRLLCQGLEDDRRQLVNSQDRDKLARERDDVIRKLTGVVAPDAADVQMRAVSRLLSSLSIANLDERILGAGFDSIVSIFIEIALAFMPGIMSTWLAHRTAANKTHWAFATSPLAAAAHDDDCKVTPSAASAAPLLISGMPEPLAGDVAADAGDAWRQGKPTSAARAQETMQETQESAGDPSAASPADVSCSAVDPSPETGLERWMSKCVVAVTGGSFSATEASKLYREWCKAEKIKAVAPGTFSRLMRDHFSHEVGRTGKITFVGHELMGRGLRVVK